VPSPIIREHMASRSINRQGVDHTDRFRELAAAVGALKAPTLIGAASALATPSAGQHAGPRHTYRTVKSTCIERRIAFDH